MLISQEQLNAIVESHSKWLRNEKDGKRSYLQGANLQGADLPNGIYQVVGCGSENRCTTYDSVNDRIICGCWNDDSGNALASFEQRINDIYGEKGKKPNKKYYLEYMSAITFFKAAKEETI